MLLEPVQSLFLGTFAMGMSTIGSGVVYICVPSFGERWIYVAWVWWWMNVVVSLLIGIGIPFLLFTKHKNNGLASVTGVWLLPVVGPIVTAAAGGIVAEVLPPYHARLTLVLSCTSQFPLPLRISLDSTRGEILQPSSLSSETSMLIVTHRHDARDEFPTRSAHPRNLCSAFSGPQGQSSSSSLSDLF